MYLFWILFRSAAHCWIGLFVFLLFICLCCLYILERKTLSLASFANIFSHSVGCHFILFMVSLAVQKLVSLISPIFISFLKKVPFFFSFLIIFLLPWETDLRKHQYNLYQRMFCLCSLLGVLWWCLLFKSLSYFEFIFVYGEVKSFYWESNMCWVL